MVYKNLSMSVKTFYGVTFNPGDIHEVGGAINSPGFIQLRQLPKEPPMKRTSATKARSAQDSVNVDTLISPDTAQQDDSSLTSDTLHDKYVQTSGGAKNDKE